MEPLDISRPSRDFQEHLNLEGNERIIFSGIFGAGKTYFLRAFFKNHPEYLPIFVNPTHYSVAQNEDIFELIKYDLLYQIILQRPYLEKVQPSDLETIPFLKFTDTARALEPFLRGIARIGQMITGASESILELKKLLDEKKESIKTDEGQAIANFINQLGDAKGSIYENDLYSQLITDLVVRVKSEKTVVLIVDDLDRIDPEHIFRIMNVFAAHFKTDEVEESKNKFGLDKIILCCDIENIRAIFRAKYGISVDFNGYIDKFYSREIFHYNNKSVVIDAVSKLLSSIKMPPEKRALNPSLTPGNYYFSFLASLITSFILSDRLNLRTLKRLNSIKYVMPIYSIHFEGGRLNNWVVPFITVCDFLVFLFGSKESTLHALKGSEFAQFDSTNTPHPEYRLSEDSLFNIFCELIALLENHHNKLVPSKDFSSDKFTRSPLPYYLQPSSIRGMSITHEPHLLGRLGSTKGSYDVNVKSEITMDLFRTLYIDAFELYTRAKTSTFNRF